MRSPTPTARRVAVWALWAGVLAPHAFAATAEKELRELTERWAGAICVLRIPMRIQEKDGEGWSHSPPYMVDREGEKPFHIRLRVSDADALRARWSSDEVPAGAVLVVEGWRADRWGAFGGFDLDMRFRDLPVRARFEFLAGRGFSLKPDRLVQLERYVRIDACQVSFPSEALPARPAAAAPEAPAAAVGSGSSTAPAYVPALRLLAASVQPARIGPGDEIALVVNYALEGLPPGAGFEVQETRELLSGDRSLTTLEDRVTRAAGTYTSSQRMRVPESLAAGLYRFRVRVRVAGLEAGGEAVFVVERER